MMAVVIPCVLLGVMTTMWPLKSAICLIKARLGGKSASAAARPKPVSQDGKADPSWGPLSFKGLHGMHYGDIFYAGVGLMVYLYTWPDSTAAAEWPTLDNFVGGWACMVLCRNLLIEIAFYEFWHQLLFGALATESITQYRYAEHSPYEPKKAGGAPQMNVWRERFWCICGFCWSTLWECYIVHAWGSGAIPACSAADGVSAAAAAATEGAGAGAGAGAGPFSLGCQMSDLSAGDITARPWMVLWFVLAFPLTTQFRGIHFFSCHRGMHPWWDRKLGLLQGDIGAFLYRHVHSLHHKSHNPGPWSSLSMHPVEHALYFSCFALAHFIPYHPLHLLCNKFHTDISALGGHDGYGAPGADDVGHYLHHSKFECNYGFSFPNYLDKWAGTYEDGKKYLPKKEK